jgi:hypothetical protein
MSELVTSVAGSGGVCAQEESTSNIAKAHSMIFHIEVSCRERIRNSR